MKNIEEFKIVGYMPNWGYFVNNVESIDFNSLTHLIIAFVNPEHETSDLGPTDGLHEVVQLAHDHNVKVMISIGGAIVDVAVWHNLQGEKYRTPFIHKVRDFLITYQLDGIDIDLEGDAITTDYSAFVAAIANEIKPLGKLISGAAARWNGNKINDEALIHFDFINMMSYDDCEPEKHMGETQHSSYGTAALDIDYWQNERGISPEKLMLGLPFYGYSFNKGANPPATENHLYKDIVSKYPEAVNTDHLNLSEQNTVYYNGIETTRKKTALALESVGGVMVWHLLFDSFGEKSLLQAINDEVTTQGKNPEKQNAAIYIKRWIQITISLEDNFETAYLDKILPYINQLKSDDLIDGFIYTLNTNGKSIILYLRTTFHKSQSIIKPQFTLLFKERLTEYRDYVLLNLGSENTHPIGVSLLSKSTKLAQNLLIKHREEWSESTAFKLLIPIHIAFTQALKMNKWETLDFYTYLLDDSLNLLGIKEQNRTRNIMNELEQNFLSQKEPLIEYITQIWTEIDDNTIEDDLMLTWKESVRLTNEKLVRLQRKNKLIISNQYRYNPSYGTDNLSQQKWSILTQYHRFINRQFNLSIIYNLHLIYAIKNTIAESLNVRTLEKK